MGRERHKNGFQGDATGLTNQIFPDDGRFGKYGTDAKSVSHKGLPPKPRRGDGYSKNWNPYEHLDLG